MSQKNDEKKEQKGKLELSDAERKRRSELAKSLHKKGVFGGYQKGAGRPKKERAQEIVAEKIRGEASNIFQALKAALDSGQPSTRLKAAIAMLEIEKSEEDYKLKQEQRMYDNFSRDKLLELISERIKYLKESGVEVPGVKTIESSATEILVKELDAGKE